MGLGRRVLAIFLVLAASVALVPLPAVAAPNCAVSQSGEVYCGGPGNPVKVPVAGRVVQLAASGDGTCALTEPGDVYCWGSQETAAEPAGSDDSGGFSPLLLITIGLLLVGGGVTLVRLAGGQGARTSA